MNPTLSALYQWGIQNTPEDPSKRTVPRQMTAEDRAWLDELMVDEFQVMKDSVTALRNESSTLEDLHTTLETLHDLLESIDNANNFHKIEGAFDAMHMMLAHECSECRAQAASCLAVSAQNNPAFQQELLARGFLPPLVGLLCNEGGAIQARTSALSAISAAVDHNSEALAIFLDQGGARGLSNLITNAHPRAPTKALFVVSKLLRYVTQEHPDTAPAPFPCDDKGRVHVDVKTGEQDGQSSVPYAGLVGRLADAFAESLVAPLHEMLSRPTPRPEEEEARELLINILETAQLMAQIPTLRAALLEHGFASLADTHLESVVATIRAHNNEDRPDDAPLPGIRLAIAAKKLLKAITDEDK
eukprot:gnl/Trimastix_PCT/3115.p1 GENE.gnl/Trimastix_PCT/3115~~gnl/Trimastix_PCT/3115.p1  ORF type:complete len:359 (-),score=66.83 gnl/Trimastix_PCT/3115:11-1087(-)